MHFAEIFKIKFYSELEYYLRYKYLLSLKYMIEENLILIFR
jgi:hypothetical protein